MNCDPAALERASRCWCLPDNGHRAAMVYLLCQWSNAGAAPGPCTLPVKAVSPTPSNGSTGVSASSPVLSWGNGGGATSFNVWFNGSFVGNTSGTSFNAGVLSHNTSYGWRVDAVNSCGVTTGDAWTFTTIIAAPSKATTPGPTNGSTGVLPYAPVLSWANGGGATSYNVWFNGAFIGNQVGTTYSPSVLGFNTAYSWRIDAVNAGGATAGDTWAFTTIDRFAYAPATSIITWTDVHGSGLTGNLAFFNANADFVSVSSVNLDNQALTSISNLAAIPALATLSLATNSVAVLDVTHNPALSVLYCDFNSLTALNLSGCPAMTFCSCPNNSITALDISTNPLLSTLYAQSNQLPVLTVNTLLSQLVTFGLTGGIVYTVGQTPAAAPTVGPPDGIASKLTLQAETPPWTVLTD